MFRFIETVKIENHESQHIEWHNKRLNETRRHFFGLLPYIDLNDILSIPADLTESTCKCRILYNKTILSVEYEPYAPKPVHSLRLIEANHLSYDFKWKDRKALEQLLAKRGDADDILIIKNGFITDTSFSNIILLHENTWYTPSTCLLNGTCRQRLLAKGYIKEAIVREKDLNDYSEVRLINAMLDMETTCPLLINNIK
jgi:4-amino-4-deoxychorismate lyase